MTSNQAPAHSRTQALRRVLLSFVTVLALLSLGAATTSAASGNATGGFDRSTQSNAAVADGAHSKTVALTDDCDDDDDDDDCEEGGGLPATDTVSATGAAGGSGNSIVEIVGLAIAGLLGGAFAVARKRPI